MKKLAKGVPWCGVATVITQPVRSGQSIVTEGDVMYGRGGLGAALDNLDVDPMPSQRRAQDLAHTLEVVESAQPREAEEPRNQIDLSFHRLSLRPS